MPKSSGVIRVSDDELNDECDERQRCVHGEAACVERKRHADQASDRDRQAFFVGTDHIMPR